MASNPKRVSFGSHGSMVETLIIDVDVDHVSPEERMFYERNRWLHTSNHSLSNSHSTRQTLVTCSDNPFHVNGELRRKADLIIARSRISRTDLRIVDPDTAPIQQPPTSALPSALRRRPSSDAPAAAAAAANGGDGVCQMKCSQSAPETVSPPNERRHTADVSSWPNEAIEANHAAVTTSSPVCVVVVVDGNGTVQGRVESAAVPTAQLQCAEEVRLSSDRSGCLPKSSSTACSRCTVS